jgi:hypothetical protein
LDVILQLRTAEEEQMMEKDLAGQLEGLFHEVGEAHHQAYIETDGSDPEWPLWYADYLQERLGGLLEASFTKSELVYMLVLVANEQPLRAPGANWARYYAGFFITRYT